MAGVEDQFWEPLSELQRGAGFSLIERGKRGVRVRVGHGVSATNHLLESEREHASASIVLDSLSERQGKQGLDGEFWGQELLEECDYLSRTCGDEDFAQRVKAEREQ